MRRIILDISEQVDADNEAEDDLANMPEEFVQGKNLDDIDKKAQLQAMLGVTGIWADAFNTEEEAIEYMNEIRRAGGRPN